LSKIVTPKNITDDSRHPMRFAANALRAAASKSAARPLDAEEEISQAAGCAGTLPASTRALTGNLLQPVRLSEKVRKCPIGKFRLNCAILHVARNLLLEKELSALGLEPRTYGLKVRCSTN
jgi:hypothetical protein